MNGKSQFADIIDQAKKQGWRHELTHGGHHKLMPPNGGMPIVTSSTPGDQRAFRNFLAGMKRSGFKAPDDREDLMEKRKVRGTKAALRDYLHDNAGKAFSVDELRLVINARVPGAHPKSLNSAISLLVGEGLAVQLGRGMYRWHELPSTRGAEAVLLAVPNPGTLEFGPLLPPEPVAGLPALEQDPDEREINQLLEDILAVSIRAEKLLRRYSSIAAKVKELKKLLG